MSDADRYQSRHRPAVDRAGDGTPEAFSLLGNETRLGILLAIWEEQVPLGPDNTVPFSRIFDRVDLDDRGNFSYHLEQLEGRFITQHTDRGGYELLIPGLKLVRSVIAGTGVKDAAFEPTPIDQPCPLCDGQTTISYQAGVVFLCCTECEGLAPKKAEIDGVLNAVYFEPAGVGDRTPEELHAASVAASMQQVRSLFDGVCPTCSGPVDGRMECCPDHDPNGCDRCGLRIGVRTHFECQICKYFGGGPPQRLALVHPAMVSFFDRHDFSTWVRAGDFGAARRVYGLIYDLDLEWTTREPPRATVTAEVGGDALSLTFDETASVVEVAQ